MAFSKNSLKQKFKHKEKEYTVEADEYFDVEHYELYIHGKVYDDSRTYLIDVIKGTINQWGAKETSEHLLFQFGYGMIIDFMNGMDAEVFHD